MSRGAATNWTHRWGDLKPGDRVLVSRGVTFRTVATFLSYQAHEGERLLRAPTSPRDGLLVQRDGYIGTHVVLPGCGEEILDVQRATVRERHERAMALIDSGYAAKIHGDARAWERAHALALPLERAAAEDLDPAEKNAELTRSVLFRSAATMALTGGQPGEALRLAGAGLSGLRPIPRETREELHDVRRKAIAAVMASLPDLVAALSAWQPWAGLLAAVPEDSTVGLKSIESRKRRLGERHIGKPVVVCSTIRYAEDALRAFVEAGRIPGWARHWLDPTGVTMALICVERCRPLVPDDEPLSWFYEPGRQAWEIAWTIPLRPNSVSGRQGIFYISKSLVRAA